MRRTDCPSRDAFEKASRTDASFEERERLADHALVCPSCRTKMEILLDVESEVSSRGREFKTLAKASLSELQPRAGVVSAARFRSARAWRKPAAVFGALLAAALAALFLFGPLGPRDGALRNGESGGLVLLSPQGEVKGYPTEFRWEAPLEANTFQFDLIDDNLTTIIPQAGMLERVYSLPIGYEHKFVPGRTYIWRVTAYDDVGRTLGAAQRSFTIRPRR